MKEGGNKKSNELKIEKVLIALKPDLDLREVKEILETLRRNSLSVFVLEASNEFEKLGVQRFAGGDVNVVFVFGGDGAILRTVERILNLPRIPPIVGVNMGKVGFLTFGEDDLARVIDLLKNGEFIVDRKKLICSVLDGREFFALNDFVFKSECLCEFDVETDMYDITKVRADGVIVSSQTGSTAYNLSVGGPLVFPDAEVFVISFIAPFSLSTRPVVVSSERRIKVKAEKPYNLYADGRIIGKKKEVEVFYSQKTIEILRRTSFNFFEVLRKKLE